MFNFTPLLGAQSDSPASQCLLELDGGVKILVDVGWDASFDAQKLQALEKHVSTLSLILLTHPTFDHLGAYAHCCKHIPLFSRIPVYATTPVINLGRTLLGDLYTSSPLAASIIPISSITSPTSSTADPSPNLLLQPPTPEEISRYFSLINPLKYSQPHQPIPSSTSPPLSNLTITAYSAGHTLGGTIWHIQHSLESIVYAADWNQGRENLLVGAAWLSSSGSEVQEALRRPTALVCSSKGVERASVLGRKKRDDTLISLIRETVAQGGKVLIPTDSSARVLEIAFLLEQTWRAEISGPHADTYRNARIYMASKSCSSTVRFLQSMLEWVDESVRAEAEAAMTTKGKGHSNPLDWKYVRQIERRSQVERAVGRSKPCVLLASDASLEWGFSRQALEKIAADSRNLVILTEKVARVEDAKGGVGRQLWEMWQSRSGSTSAPSGAKIVDTDGTTVDIPSITTAPLNDNETALYQTYIARQRQQHSTLEGDNTLNETNGTGQPEEAEAEESSDSEDEDEDAEHQGRALNISAQLTQSNKRKAAAVGLTDAELGVNVLIRGRNVYDYDVRNKRGREKVFPFLPHRGREDEYGEVIKAEDYLRAEERDDVDGVDLRAGGQNALDGGRGDAGVGQKRKWDDVSSSSHGRDGKGGGRKGARPPTKRARVEKGGQAREPDDIDAAIARATGQSLVNGTAKANTADVDVEDESGESEESDYEPENSLPDGAPQKAVFTSHPVELHCRITHVDFSAIHDLRDLSMIIPLVRPRKLILISGEESETKTLAAECKRLLSGEGDAAATDIFTPVVGETVDASVDTNAWTLKLSRQLVKKLTWQNVKGLGIVALTGRLDAAPVTSEDVKVEEGEGAKKKLKMIKTESISSSTTDPAVKKGAQETKETIPVLDLVTTAATVASLPTHPLHVGDLRLAQLRHLLATSGHICEFRGEGTLLIDGNVVVRKSAGGRIEVESDVTGFGKPMQRVRPGMGGIEGSFFAVKRAVYEGLAVVGGV